MKTGTDISIAECRASGYPVVDHGKSPMDPTKYYLLTISNPNKWGFKKKYIYAGFVSYADLWESFERGGAGIKSFCDFENCPYPSPAESPSFSDFVSLAGTVHAWHGLD